jgi:type IX secretion system PorP/SprF family membrane protein
MIRRASSFLFLFLALSSTVWAQDPQFSQIFAHPLYLNPAFTGSAGGPRFALGYRNQWPRIPNAFKTVAASADAPFFFGGRDRVPRHGLGLSLLGDQAGAGVLTKMYATFNYSFLIPLGRDYDHGIRFGVAGGIQQASIDFFRLRFPNQFTADGFDPNIPVSELRGITSANRIHEQVNAGVLYTNKIFYLGVSAFNLTTPTQNFIPDGNSANAKLPMRLNAYTGVNIPLNSQKPDGPSISPAVMYRMQGPFSQLDLGLYVNLDPIVIGTWYRMNDAMIFLVGLKRGIFSFGYSYDYTVSSLTNAASGGAHEVSVGVTLEGPERRGRRPSAKMSCPRF